MVLCFLQRNGETHKEENTDKNIIKAIEMVNTATKEQVLKYPSGDLAVEMEDFSASIYKQRNLLQFSYTFGEGGCAFFSMDTKKWYDKEDELLKVRLLAAYESLKRKFGEK